MQTPLITLLASHTTPVYTDPMIARVLAGGAIGLCLIVVGVWSLAKTAARAFAGNL